MKAIVLLLCVSLAGCVDSEQADDSKPPEAERPPSGQMPSQQNNESQQVQLGPELNLTQMLILDECQNLFAELVGPRALLPYPAPEGWEDNNGNLDEWVYLEALRCRSVSVGGIHTVEDVSFGWFSHTNVSANDGQLDGVFRNRFHASVAIFTDNDIVRTALASLGIDTVQATVTVPDPETLHIEFEAGEVKLEMPGYTFSENATVDDVVDVLVPTSSPEFWMLIGSDNEFTHLHLAATLSVSGDTPLNAWWEAHGAPPLIKANLSASTKMEVQIHALD